VGVVVVYFKHFPARNETNEIKSESVLEVFPHPHAEHGYYQAATVPTPDTVQSGSNPEKSFL
jgi:hypothetical protein